ncbi:protein spindle-F isoform X1 [Nylanderia fulva]|uniref:protein spindle-F isoform X1 n=1 Tax=Nylanderia fulva TaxID=613905 RepID=UPI0010FB4E10|nr:protein spindle-F isoform X1 [Nylanderia fulva]
MNENLENVTPESYYALLVAFETMKERCQRLQTRLVAAEKENMRLKLECSRNSSTAVVKANNSSDESTLQEKIEELTKQKLQLSDHMFMVAAENRQLWNRLTRLTKTNKSLGSQLNKISDTLKQYSPMQPSDITCNIRDASSSDNNKKYLLMDGEKEQSLEEISLRLINSIMLEKSDLEQQYAEMVELQNNSELNLQKIGFTYPEDSDTDSELKQLEIRLSQTKDALLGQQTRLKRTLQNLKKMRKGTTCNNCRENANKKMCQTGTQFDSNDSFKEHGATQTSLMTPSISIEKYSNLNDNLDIANTCPLCGTVYGKSKSFTEFHEHVLNHFTKDVSTSDDFELVH